MMGDFFERLWDLIEEHPLLSMVTFGTIFPAMHDIGVAIGRALVS